MNSPEQREFSRKAPLVPVDQLAEFITDELLPGRLLERTESIWLFASFVYPETEIDSGEKPSDLDVFVCVPEWELPIAEPGIAISSGTGDVPSIFTQMENTSEWNGTGGPGKNWDCDATEAWATLPPYVRECLENSLQHFFFATEEDHEQGRARNYDLHVGNRDHLEYVTEGNTGLCIWESGKS